VIFLSDLYQRSTLAMAPRDSSASIVGDQDLQQFLQAWSRQQQSVWSDQETVGEKDYARMHENFLESMLQEQLRLKETSLPSDKTRTRKRPLRLSIRSSIHRRMSMSRVTSIGAYRAISLEALSCKDLPPPSSFVHPRCKLQKDKGKGKAIGSAISAEGQDDCLVKLREKMAVVAQVAGGEDRKAAADMKRRDAKVSEYGMNYVETRSMIELRMGFLSMQYGLLLRWDTSGKVIFVVLRKICHDSFYTKINDNIKPPKQMSMKRTSIAKKQLESPSLVVQNTVDNHTIYNCGNGMEVVLGSS